MMSDAGITVYNDIIDQHTLGFDFIRENLGPCAQTRTGWHVDQFGHSSEHASIFAQVRYIYQPLILVISAQGKNNPGSQLSSVTTCL